MSKTEQILRFAATLAREFPGLSVPQIMTVCRLLRRHTARYTRLAELACNRVLTGKELRDRQATAERLQSVVRSLPAGVHNKRAVLVLGGDPRGFVVRLQLPSGASDGVSWDPEEGYGVPV